MTKQKPVIQQKPIFHAVGLLFLTPFNKYENWTPENEGNNPQIIPIEEYLDCCWEEMTGLKE